jgi:chemotaxis protein histidine kinase CheA
MPDKQATEPAATDRDNPVYFDNEVIDHLISIVLELGAELFVTRDRLARLEERLASGEPVTLEELDQGRPSQELQERLNQERQAFIQQVYGRLYSRYGGDKASGQAAL